MESHIIDLRMRFCTENGKAMQYVDGAYCDEIDFVEFHSPDEMRKFCNKQAHIPFEMNGSQMFRITVFELPESSGIMLCASHLIADAWTYSVLAKDVFDIYLMGISKNPCTERVKSGIIEI